MLGIAGIASSSAQVYSVNAVGYVNVAIPPGFSMIANPLDAANNALPSIFQNPPDGLTVYKFNPTTGFAQSTFDQLIGEWSDPAMTLAPGEGAFVRNVGTTRYTNTFVGEVKTGTLTTSLSRGFSIASSQVPQSGDLKTVLGFPDFDGATIYRFSNAVNNYLPTATFDTLVGGWDPAAPVPGVGEAFWVFIPGTGAAVNWTREFSIN